MNETCYNSTINIIDGYNRTIPVISQECITYHGKVLTYQVDMTQVLPELQFKYLLGMLLSAAYLLFYVLFNVFVVESEKKRNICKNLDLWAIIPVIYLFVMIGTMVIGFKGL